MIKALSLHPGLLRLFLTSIVARLSMGALGLLAILRVQDMTGSYAAGGAVAAAYALSNGLSAPVLGRLVDTRGQTAVIALGGLLHAAALAGFAALGDGAGVAPALVLMAVAGLAQPPLTAAQRTIWSERLTDATDRHKVYSLESAIFEIVYISGPLILVGVVGAWSLHAAILACGLLTAVGSLAFVATPVSRDWRPHPDRATGRAGALRAPAVRTLIAVFVLFGAGMAGIEIAVAAFAAAEGAKSAVGPVLGVWGLGSMIGGFAAARAAAPADTTRRIVQMLTAIAIGSAALAAASDLWTLSLIIFFAGIGIAPGLSVAFGLLSDVAPTGTVTEAQTFASTGMASGFALGSAIGGQVVEGSGPTGAFFLAAAVLGLAAVLVAARRPSPVLRPVLPCAGG